MTGDERRRAWLMAVAIVALHALGGGLLLAGGGAIGLGVGLTAYTLGMRHAFDADHIAAIDNTTRKLMGEGQRPLSVGFFFSLGHSTVVLGLGVAVMLGVRGIGNDVGTATGLIGPLVSGSFLMLIGLLNLVVLARIVAIFRRLRRGSFDEGELEAQLAARGGLARVYGRATRAVRAPWHMYPLGVLFGLGFDTATEIALLVLAAGAAAGGLPASTILCLPILFAAGMALFDTIDGAFMNLAYGWAFADPVRKLIYNIAVTALSVAVALGVGALELTGVLAGELGLRGGVWDQLAGVDLNMVGYAVAGLFAATLALALLASRLSAPAPSRASR